MAPVLAVMSVLCALGGFSIYGSAQTIFQQSLALNLFIVAAVLFSGASIVGAIERMGRRLMPAPPAMPELPPMEKGG